MKKDTQIKNIISSSKLAVYVSTGKIIALFSTFGIQIFLTRYLTKEEYGVYSQFIMIVLFVSSIFSFGIQSNLFYFYPKNECKYRKTYVSHTIILLLFFSLVATISLKLKFFSIFLTGGGEIDKYINLIIVGVIAAMPTFILETLYVVKRDLTTSILFPPIKELLKAIIVIGSALLFSGVNTIIFGLIIGMVISAIFALKYTYCEIALLDKNAPFFNKNILIQQLNYSIPFGFAVIVNTIISRIDKLVSITYLSITEYASYSVAFFGVPGIQLVFDSLGQVIIIRIVEAINNNDKESILNIFRQFASKTFSFTIPIICIVSLFAKKIIMFLFSEKYIDTVPLFQLYLISFIFGMFGSGIILRAAGKTKLTLYAYIFTALLVIPATYILIPKFGVWGAMSTALLSSFLPRLIMMIMEIKVFKYTFKEYIAWRNLFQIISISFLTLIPFLIIEHYLSYNIFISIILGISYLLLVFAFEIKYGLFIINKQFILNFISKHRY